MTHKVRKITAFISFLLFPLTLNFFSPYVSIDGAMMGIISGSLLIFVVMFLSGLIFRRAWCSYVCPWAAPSEYLTSVNNKTVNRHRLAIIRYSIFGVWATILIIFFILAGGVKGLDPLHLTEHYVSIDEPMKFITYYMVVLILFLTTVLIGKRGACHSICWMSPFLVLGSWVGSKLKMPQFKVISQKEKCIACKKCNLVCPMSIDVLKELQNDQINSYDCILCGQCTDVCPKSVLKIQLYHQKSEVHK